MMRHRDPNRLGDRMVFWLCLTISFMLYTVAVYDYGVAQGRVEPRKCATVSGEQVVSTTADVCTYAATYGRATTKRRAG